MAGTPLVMIQIEISSFIWMVSSIVVFLVTSNLEVSSGYGPGNRRSAYSRNTYSCGGL